MDENPSAPLGPGKLYRFAWGFYLLLSVAGIVWIGISRRLIPLSLFVDRERWWLDLALGLGAGAALLGAWMLTVRFSHLARQLEDRLAGLLGPLTGTDAIALALLSGFAEELFFRGALQAAVGWGLATLIFGLLHSGSGSLFRLWTFFACLAGAVFGLLMLWRGNLLAPIVGHFVVNAVNLARLGRRSARFARLSVDSEQDEKES